ncbi:MAG: tetratricopeptide repeat protein [Humidesulfovibrio sp.]
MTKKKQRQPIHGVFSQAKVSMIGAGTTARKTETVTYFYAQEREDGVLEVQALGDQVVFGPVTELSLDEFLENYLPEPQKSLERAQGEEQRQGKLHKALARGDKFYQQGKTYSAEFEYGKALVLDEDSVRANFGIGLCYIARGEQDKAREVLGRLVRLEAAFQDEHKHLFNEFGIALRKAGMHAEALAYYARALELSPDDENLHYNMARAFYDLGDAQTALQRLTHCLSLNPEHAEARRFMDFLKRAKPAGG